MHPSISKDGKDSRDVKGSVQSLGRDRTVESAADFLLDPLGREPAKEFRYHALTLTLLGNFLRRAHNGDVRKRREIDLDQAPTLWKQCSPSMLRSSTAEFMENAGRFSMKRAAFMENCGRFTVIRRQFMENAGQFSMNRTEFSENCDWFSMIRRQFTENRGQFSMNRTEFLENCDRFTVNRAAFTVNRDHFTVIRREITMNRRRLPPTSAGSPEESACGGGSRRE